MNRLLQLLTLALLAAIGGQTALAQPAQDNDLLAPTPSRFAQFALDSQRSEPADYVRDILVLIDLGEATIAKPVFEELVAIELTDAQRAALVERVGTAALIRIARAEELGERRTAFVTAVMEAAGRQAASPERLAELIERVTGDNPAARKVAFARLQSAGQSAVVAFLAALAGEQDEFQQNHLREALVRLAPLSTPALAAALDAPQDSVRTQAAWALGQIGDRLSIPRLAGLAAGPDYDTAPGKAARWAVKQMTGVPLNPPNAAPLLDAALDQALAGVPPRRPNDRGEIAVWSWDTQSGAPVAIDLPANQAGMIHAARLATDLWRLNEGSTEYLIQALALRLHGEWLLSHAGSPVATLPGPVMTDAPGALLSVGLRLASGHDLTGASIALSQELGERGVQDVLYSTNGEPTPLAAALASPHPAVRFSAIEAVMKLKPTSPFPGSSRVADALIYFATSDGAETAVVAMPRTLDASTLGGYLMRSGIETSITNFGDEVTCRLIENADIQFVIIDMGLLRPVVREVLFRLRREPQTSLVPVALLAADGRLEDAQRLARRHDGVLAFPRPHSAKAVEGIVEQLKGLTPVGSPDADTRARQARAVAGWIQSLLADGPSFYNLRGRQAELLAAVNRAPETEVAIPSLALLGTPNSQQSLANLASLDVLPLDTRHAAAAAFDQSVQRHGLLLSTQQILDQYDRYNASQNDPAEVQQVLGAMLDSIESLRDAAPQTPGS